MGKGASEIAIILAISARTVEQHLLNVKKKLQCSKVTDIVRVLISLDLVEIILNLSFDEDIQSF